MNKPFDLSLYLVTDPEMTARRGLVETVAAAIEGGVTMVQLRDKGGTARAMVEAGRALHALLAPRGMLEFWVDPESPYYKEIFGSGKEFVLYCQAAWRSALAAKTLEEMGLPRVCHMEGGYAAWKESGAPTVAREAHQPKK